MRRVSYQMTEEEETHKQNYRRMRVYGNTNTQR